MCGVKRQDILGVFQKYGTLEDLVMLPGKSYCYVLYSSLENAEKAVMNLNGRKLLNEMSLSGTILYLAYLTKKPCLHLCTLDQTYPSGIVLVEDFIDETEENVLLKCFSNCKESKDTGMTLTDSETSGKSSPSAIPPFPSGPSSLPLLSPTPLSSLCSLPLPSPPSRLAKSPRLATVHLFSHKTRNPIFAYKFSFYNLYTCTHKQTELVK